MHNKFKVEIGNILAGSARASRPTLDVSLPIAKRQIGSFDQFEDRFSARDERFWHVGEDRIAFEFVNSQEFFDLNTDGLQQVTEDLV
jgi:hypothetical protein